MKDSIHGARIQDIGQIAAVVLAGGRGLRMRSQTSKMLLKLNGKPIVQYIVQTLQRLALDQIIVVVGYQAEAVCEVVNEVADSRVCFVLHEQLLGTGDALRVACNSLSEKIAHVLVVNGDDSAFYKATTLTDFVALHVNSHSTITLLFAKRDPDIVFGRVYQKQSGEFEFITQVSRKSASSFPDYQ